MSNLFFSTRLELNLELPTNPTGVAAPAQDVRLSVTNDVMQCSVLYSVGNHFSHATVY